MNHVPMIILIVSIPLYVLMVWLFSTFSSLAQIGTAISYDILYFVDFVLILLYTKVFTKNEEVKKCAKGFEIQKEFYFEIPITNFVWSLNDYTSIFSIVILSGAVSVKEQAASLISYCIIQFVYIWPLSCS